MMKSGAVRQQHLKGAKSQDKCGRFVLCMCMYVRFCISDSSSCYFHKGDGESTESGGLAHMLHASPGKCMCVMLKDEKKRHLQRRPSR